jgi:hypothetical protein
LPLFNHKNLKRNATKSKDMRKIRRSYRIMVRSTVH